MEEQMCSPEKYWMKNSYNKILFGAYNFIIKVSPEA